MTDHRQPPSRTANSERVYVMVGAQNMRKLEFRSEPLPLRESLIEGKEQHQRLARHYERNRILSQLEEELHERAQHKQPCACEPHCSPQ